MPPSHRPDDTFDARRAGTAPGARPLRVAVIGNHPPRRCGIAAFTRDVAASLERAGCALHVTAMSDAGPDRAGYPPAVAQVVDASSRGAHVAAGRAVAAWRPDAVLVEHEFGIYGGPAGAWLLDLLAETDAPALVRLHTVLAEPDRAQGIVLDGLARRAVRLVVMARAGRETLAARGIASGRVALLPHGAPDRPLREPAEARRALGWDEAPTLLTFGLLSSGKGIETVIDALPAILEAVPDARYRLVGATHPHLAAREGEAYRESLVERALALGVARAFETVPRFVDDDELLDMLAAADVYVTPYTDPQQVTSGTLAYARALGRPIVSTPYVHAREIVPPERLVPFGDAGALGRTAGRLLADPDALERIAAETWAAGRTSVWPVVGARLADLLARIADRAGAGVGVAA